MASGANSAACKTARRLDFTQARTILAAALLASGLQAKTFNVNTTEEFTANNDGKCSLWEALRAVNQRDNGGSSGCVPVNDVSWDRIVVPQGNYPITSTHTITQSVDIVGAGMDKTVFISTATFTFDVTIDFDPFRPELTASPDVTMDGMTLKGPDGIGGTMGIHVKGSYVLQGRDDQPWVPSLWASNIRITNFTFAGGLLNEGGNVQLLGCLIHNNKGFRGGGLRNYGYTSFGGYMYVYYSAIYNNTAHETQGGGIDNHGYLQLFHSTVSGNTGKNRGGGIYHGQREIFPGVDDQDQTHINDPPRPYLGLWHTTVANNKAPSGGGVYVNSSVPGIEVSSQYSIIANNFKADGTTRDDFRGPVRTDASFALANLVRSATGTTGLITGTDITGQDPRLGSLTSDNGCAWTAGCITYTHRLNSGSPAIDKAASFEDLRDQRGFVRPADGNASAGSNEFDLGAYEYDPRAQNERLAVANSSGDAHSKVFPEGEDYNGWTRFMANATNDQVTYTVLVPASGTYSVRVRIQKNPDAGKFQAQVASSASGTYANVGSVQDAYASTSSFTERTLGNTTFSSSGKKYFRFKVAGKNSASSGTRLYFDYIKLVKQ